MKENDLANFQSPVHRVSHCYTLSPMEMARSIRPFSPLFIGSLIVTSGRRTSAACNSTPFSPLFIGSLIVTIDHPCPKISFLGLSVPCSSGLSLLREFQNSNTRDSSFFQSPVHRVSHCYCGSIKTRASNFASFQSPVHRVSHCYCIPHPRRRPPQKAFSPLFIGSLIVTPDFGNVEVVLIDLSVPCSSGLSLLH